MPSKRPEIKWRDSDEEKLSRAVRNYNRKLDRLAKKQPYLRDMLPDRLSKRELKNRITTRQDFNRVVRSAERFSKRGAESLITNEAGFAITKYEKREVSYKLAVINRKRAEQLRRYEEMEVINQGKGTGIKRGQMPSQRLAALKPKRFNWDKMTRQHYEAFLKTLNKQAFDKYTQEMDAMYKWNYIKALKQVLPPKYAYIIEKVKQMDPEEVIERFYTDQNATIDFIYDPVALNLKAEVLDKVWS